VEEVVVVCVYRWGCGGCGKGGGGGVAVRRVAKYRRPNPHARLPVVGKGWGQCSVIWGRGRVAGQAGVNCRLEGSAGEGANHVLEEQLAVEGQQQPVCCLRVQRLPGTGAGMSEKAHDMLGNE